uniref:Uncharacterized protein n=1 Tax=Nostoc flagelliforme str. Sunitezuoqi TaxID=676037 RepID=E7DPY0_9NOSO|nr:hypothetical protein Nfla_5502 [Nostoc flagelliforme str. Sunitezuoqi]
MKFDLFLFYLLRLLTIPAIADGLYFPFYPVVLLKTLKLLLTHKIQVITIPKVHIASTTA